MKICSKCKTEKPSEAFSPKKFKSGNTGLRSQCKACESQAALAWRTSNPEKARESWRKASNKHSRKATLRKYGITEDVFDRMKSEQNGVCAICKVKEAVVVDHCHKTGMVRGLLCSGCNCALGFMEDNPERLVSGADYLRRRSLVG